MKNKYTSNTYLEEHISFEESISQQYRWVDWLISRRQPRKMRPQQRVTDSESS